MNTLKVLPALFAVTALCHGIQVQAEGKHWAYGGHGGPAEWGTLDKAFATCKLGKVQSPIAIKGAKAAERPFAPTRPGMTASLVPSGSRRSRPWVVLRDRSRRRT